MPFRFSFPWRVQVMGVYQGIVYAHDLEEARQQAKLIFGPKARIA